LRYARSTGEVRRFKYGDDWLVEEHVFAGVRGDPASRWILGTALDLREDKTVLSVFDVHGVADGPIAQARLPYSVPLGLHGSYVAG
jgi:carotenoid cleavage dioxygenase